MDSPPRYYRCSFMCPYTFSRLASHSYSRHPRPVPHRRHLSAPLRYEVTIAPLALASFLLLPEVLTTSYPCGKYVSPRTPQARENGTSCLSQQVRQCSSVQHPQYGPAPNRALLGLHSCQAGERSWSRAFGGSCLPAMLMLA